MIWTGRLLKAYVCTEIKDKLFIGINSRQFEQKNGFRSLGFCKKKKWTTVSGAFNLQNCQFSRLYIVWCSTQTIFSAIIPLPMCSCMLLKFLVGCMYEKLHTLAYPYVYCFSKISKWRHNHVWLLPLATIAHYHYHCYYILDMYSYIT